jgi:hypothetical protein
MNVNCLRENEKSKTILLWSTKWLQLALEKRSDYDEMIDRETEVIPAWNLGF